MIILQGFIPGAKWSDLAQSAERSRSRSISSSSDTNQWSSLQGQSASSQSLTKEETEEDNSSHRPSASSSRTTSECVSEPSNSENADMMSLLEEMFPNLSLALIESKLQNCDFDLESTVLKLLQDDHLPENAKIVTSSKHRSRAHAVEVKLAASEKTTHKKSKRKAKKKSHDSSESLDKNSEALSASEIKSMIINK